ncbi:hypothetical protein M2175_006987 [Bradyrhizobium elkanii]|uniref:hypothetical protein n=1 Tax=Bradyrhizobium TaxID=374 RepID=UPI001FFB9896|nr:MULTISPECIES: hypothetical protein [Bradyrhizobium]MCK1463505.1 hypothetical protein [Bradyrhizobium sp. 2]MCS3931956.1 hypothetical protein [Bradyrhizobium elkanii]MCS3972514.1 hypothetical protein [Bradyrhizobium japonicum]
MSDARWTDVDKDPDYALMHHGMAIRLFEAAGFDAPDLDGYRNSRAFMHAMGAGYTSIENALLGFSISSVKRRHPARHGTRISSTAYRGC